MPIWRCPGVEPSLVLLEEGVCCDPLPLNAPSVHSLSKTLLAFDLLHFVLHAKFACYSRYLLTFCFCISAPYNGKDIFF